MILSFKKFFDKEKQKPTNFDKKILSCCHNILKMDLLLCGGFNSKSLNVYNFDFKDYKPKIQTILEDKKNRWKAGNKIHCYNFDVGSFRFFKNKYQFAPDFLCRGTQSIQIIYSKMPCGYYKTCVFIDNILFYDSTNTKTDEIDKFAINDGFDSYLHFFSWFNKDFTGKIIHFTDFKY